MKGKLSLGNDVRLISINKERHGHFRVCVADVREGEDTKIFEAFFRRKEGAISFAKACVLEKITTIICDNTR